MTSTESYDSNIIIVDGIEFETLVPDRVIVVPAAQRKSVKFGLSVTNQTPMPYRFIFFDLLPEILSPNGEIMRTGRINNGVKVKSEADFVLARPGEKLTSFVNARFCWGNFQLNLSGGDRSSGFWGFRNFKYAATYGVRFTYENKSAVRRIHHDGIIGGLWTGTVSTPWSEFRLVKTIDEVS